MPDPGMALQSRHRLPFRSIALPLLWLCAPTLHAGDLSSVFERMEPGSIIKDLLIPRYDENKKASMILRADRMKVESLHSITARNITLHMITSRSNKALNGSLFAMESCRYDLQTGMLRSEAAVRALSANFLLHSQGLITKVEKNQPHHTAFLLPPVFGYLNPNSDDPIAMNRTRQSLTLAALLTAQAAAQGTPAAPTPGDQAFFSVAPASKEIDARLKEFAQEHGINVAPVPLPPAPDSALSPVDPVQEMPQFAPAVDALGFACKGGVFYDSKSASLTLLKDITVRNPEYAMTVKGEAKIIFEPEKEKKTTPAAPEEKDKKPDAGAANSLGKMKQLLGTGGVAFEATDKDGVKNFASGDEVIYEIASEEIYLKGRKLIFQQGNTSRFESSSPDAWLRFNKKTKDFTMSDGWNARLTVPEKKTP
jgi:hypothetical protein